jgi:hypothetical protein
MKAMASQYESIRVCFPATNRLMDNGAIRTLDETFFQPQEQYAIKGASRVTISPGTDYSSASKK